MVDYLTGRLLRDVKPEDSKKPTTTPSLVPVRQPELEPTAVAVSAVLARARKEVKQRERVRRNRLVPASQTLEGPGASTGMGAC